jgi:betaine lipid synthase
MWLGCSRSRDTSRVSHAFEVEGGNIVGNCSPSLTPLTAAASATDAPEMAPLDLGSSALGEKIVAPIPDAVIINVTPPLSSFHYQIKHVSLLFNHTSPDLMPKRDSHGVSPISSRNCTPNSALLYTRSPGSFQPLTLCSRLYFSLGSREDPVVDLQHMQVTENDTIFAIASAGDNVLHYAINARPKRIHAVDMNPCQGHLVELKLAAIKALDYEDVFSMFGEGKIVNFRQILDCRLSPYLSSAAYQFWRVNSQMFDKSFYRRGYSGWALRFTRWLIRANGLTKAANDICAAKTIEEQNGIWKSSLRKLFVEGSIVQRLVDSPIFLWNALGVRARWSLFWYLSDTAMGNRCHETRKMLLQRRALCRISFGIGSNSYRVRYHKLSIFHRDTLDPIGSHALLSKGAYHYLLVRTLSRLLHLSNGLAQCLLGKYTRESCPDYLTRRGFEILKNNEKAMDSFRIHTDSILQWVYLFILMTAGSLTTAVVCSRVSLKAW